MIDRVANAIQRNVNGICITEQVVQIAQDLLVRACEEDTQVVGFAFFKVVHANCFFGLAGFCIDEFFDDTVRVTSQIGQCSFTVRLFTQAVNWHNREQLSNRPGVWN
ncbi:hypothetical protein D3C87_1446120 [compost metagenome]